MTAAAADAFLDELVRLTEDDAEAPGEWRGSVPWRRPYGRVLREWARRPDGPRPPAFQDGRARPEQLLPGTPGAEGALMAGTGEPITDPDSWTYWLLRSGRGFGKTETGAQAVIEWAKQGIGPMLLAGRTASDVRDTMVEAGPSSILKLAPADFMPDYEPSKLRLTFPNGVLVQLRSADEPEGFRGVQFVKAWLDELAAWKHLDQCWEQIRYVMRVKTRKRNKVQVVITTTPRPVPVINRLSGVKKHRSEPLAARTALTVRPSDDNISNLAEEFVQTIEEVRHTRLGRQEVEGELLEDVEGALWRQGAIDEDRITELEWRKLRAEGLKVVRVATGVDPPGGRTECGIVTVAKGSDRHAYVLDDASLAGDPQRWVPATLASMDRNEGDLIVAEVNYGGDMVPHALTGAGKRAVKVKVVRATRGKQVRAEPCALLYDRHLVHHVGPFPRLEGEMTEYVPDEAKESPNRMDALVWALTELFGLYDDKNPYRAGIPKGGEGLLRPMSSRGGWSQDPLRKPTREERRKAPEVKPVFLAAAVASPRRK